MPRRPSCSSVLAAAAVAALLTVLAGPARAQELPPSGGLFDLVGARALGTGAAVAGTSGTEAMFANPGATGVRTGYVAEALGVNERRGAATTTRFLGVAVVDGVSSPVTTSMAYLASTKGDATGNLFYMGFSGAWTERMRVGVQGRYLKLGGPDRINAVTADAGLNWELTSLVTLGVSGFNLLPTGHPDSLPQVMGAGLAVGSDTVVRVLADWKGTFLPHGVLASRYGVGTEGLVGGMLALRAGWLRDELLHTTWWSGGVGLISGDGFSIDFGYRQSTEAPSARELALSLRYYPPQ